MLFLVPSGPLILLDFCLQIAWPKEWVRVEIQPEINSQKSIMASRLATLESVSLFIICSSRGGIF